VATLVLGIESPEVAGQPRAFFPRDALLGHPTYLAWWKKAVLNASVSFEATYAIARIARY